MDDKDIGKLWHWQMTPRKAELIFIVRQLIIKLVEERAAAYLQLSPHKSEAYHVESALQEFGIDPITYP